MRIITVAALLLAATLAGCVGDDGAEAQSFDESAPAITDSYAVVGLQDNGINPYHITFRDDFPRAFEHPSTYIDGYPEDAIALEISLDADDYWDAIRADCEEIWSNIELGQLYWFPGTKIIGAITLQSFNAPDCNDDEPYIPAIVASSHGTMTASRATSIEYGACKECLTVMVEGFNQEGVEWLGENANWIDVQSHSWGPVVPVNNPTPSETGVLTANPEFNQAVEESAQKNLAFWASGNGAAFRYGVLGHPSTATPHFGPSVIIVGGHDSGYINTWPGFWPHIISDSCRSWAAYHTSMDESADNVGGGTSGATPFAAGIAADILLQARTILGDTNTGVDDGIVARGDAGNITEGPLADGEFTMEEWREVLFKTATPRPERQHEDGAVCSIGSGIGLYDSTPVKWTDVPDEYPAYVHIGYGAADNASRDKAFAVLSGAEPLPDRPMEDQWFALDHETRTAMHEANTLG